MGSRGTLLKPLALDPAYPRYAVGVGSWFVGWTIQSVVFGWIVVGELQASTGLFGVVQGALTLPGAVLALVGGAIADRADRRRLLVALHCTFATLALALCAAIEVVGLSAPILIAYALAAGAVQGLVLPARAALLYDVAGTDLTRAVTIATAVQSAAQVLGPVLGISARFVGTTRALVLQSAVVLIGALALATMRAIPSRTEAPRGAFAEIRDGLVFVWRSVLLRHLVLVSFAQAVLYLGPLHVLVPLVVRDAYAGGVTQLALAMAAFPLGIAVGSVGALSRRPRSASGGGGALVVALVGSALCLATIALGVPAVPFVLTILAWGACASVFFNASRVLLQEAAPSTHRGRIFAAHALAIGLAGPSSVLAATVLAHWTGSLMAFAVHGAATFVVAVYVRAVVRTPTTRE